MNEGADYQGTLPNVLLTRNSRAEQIDYGSDPTKAQIRVLSFDHASGMKATSGELQGFAIAGSDRKFVWARARIDGEKVIVWSDSVSEPASVRYGWSGNPTCNLINVSGFPASPFRTDMWE